MNMQITKRKTKTLHTVLNLAQCAELLEMLRTDLAASRERMVDKNTDPLDAALKWPRRIEMLNIVIGDLERLQESFKGYR